MSLIPNNHNNIGDGLSSHPPFASDEAQFAELSEIQAKVDQLYQNLESEMEENRQLNAILCDDYDEVIAQISRIANEIILEGNDQLKLSLESKKRSLEENGNSIRKEIEENELRCKLLLKTEEYLELLQEESILTAENDIWKEITEDLKQPATKEVYIAAVQYFQTLHTIEDFRNFLEFVNYLPVKDQEIWKSILESPLPGINAIPILFIAKDNEGNVLGEQVEIVLPLSTWKAHGLEKVCTSVVNPIFELIISEEDFNEFLACLTSCRSDKVLTEKNVDVIMGQAKGLRIKWLYEDCCKKDVNPLLLVFVTKDSEDRLGEQIELALTFSEWKGHGKFFENACMSLDKLLLECMVEEDSLHAFLECLATNCSDTDMTLDNLEDMIALSIHFGMEWLLKDCYRFIKDLQKLKNKPDSFNDKEIKKVKSLSKLPKKFKLADLECLMFFKGSVLPDGTVSIKSQISKLKPFEKGSLIHYLSYFSSFYTPKMEFMIMDFSAIDAMLFNNILKRVKFPVTLRIEGVIPSDLNQILEDAPNIKSMKIIYDCKANEPKDLLSLIENNASLSSLELCLINYDNNGHDNFQTFWSVEHREDEDPGTQYMYEAGAAEKDLKRAIKTNDRIRYYLNVEPLKIEILQSNLQLDFDKYDALKTKLRAPSKKRLHRHYVFTYSGR